jgi:hypothetical protein
LHLYSLAKMPASLTRGVFIALGIAVFLLSAVTVWRHSRTGAVVTAVLMFGAVVMVFTPTGILLAEAWAGLFIALSVCAYLRRRWTVGTVLGLAALFLRELAAPYCVLCFLFSVRARRRTESGLWLAGAVAYAIYFGVHFWQATIHRQPGDLAMTGSWLQGGGLGFIMATIRVNGCLLVWPGWAASIFCGLGAAAALTCATPGYLRASMLVYLVFFALVGMPVNQYWGWMTAFLWPMAVGFGVDPALQGIGRIWPVRDIAAMRLRAPQG